MPKAKKTLQQSLDHHLPDIDDSLSWRLGNFSDIVEVNPKTDTAHLDDDIPVTFLPMECISEDGRILARLTRQYSEVKNGYTVFREDDVLFPKITPCMENGKGAVATGLLRGLGFGSTEFFVLRPKSGVLSEFVFQATRSPSFRSAAVRFMTGSAGQQRVQRGIFSIYPIRLPPAAEQRRIATILATVDEAIAATDGVIKNLEAVREAIGRKLFTQGICHTDFVKTRLGSYPRAWNLKPLGEIADIGSGTALGRKLSGPLVRLPYLRVANVQDGYLDLSEIKYIDILESEREKWLLEVGDILLTEGGDWDKLGRGTIWNGEIENCIHQNHIFRVRLTDSAFDVRFVHYLLSSFYGKRYFKQASKQSTNLASINQKQLRSFVVLQPPLGEQRRIAATLSAFDDRLALERAERDRLVALKKGLMQVLLTGKVRVPPGVAEGVAPAHA